MLGNIKATILAFVNEARKKSFSGTQLDVAIQTCLNDLSNLNFLIASDTSQSLTAESYSLNCPSLYREEISIVLNDGSCDLEPLIKLPGGYTEYKQLMVNFHTGLRSDPTNYAELDGKFWLWPAPGKTYTVTINHYKYHAQNVNSIEFSEEFRNAINFGTTYYKSLFEGNLKYLEIWAPNYLAEKEMRRLNMNTQPHITR